MRIGLIRHGLTDWNAAGRIQGQTDIPLNAEGRQQAERLGHRLLTEDYQWDYIITSGLSRAQETGEIISGLLDVPMLEPDARLKERGFGQIEGLTSEERITRWGMDWETLDLGQEQIMDIQTRALAFLEDLWAAYQDKNVLIVTHGAFLANLLSALFKDRYTERIGNLSLTILEKEQDDWSPLLYNCTRHLSLDAAKQSE
ncbi:MULTISPECIES: histidine phosphatase family protein [Paenibacillus]|uniref:histidine phosphatase family protein n=1 Tax=Paenibacillus TaxID=44249 RepID=UPI00129E3E5D|nr:MULTISPECIES: histidine phosphatase family protein [Paenibacillus]MBE7682471.1 histidine phosphatase family protein [Paenibacillus sp. P13VS]MBY0220619.1 histidine phosphatase family protein [Paenibacillus illinoisensis]MCM3207851.1 histidine phosphatase family protein [Paenibacillus illinoisensis]WJH28706.1 histidine phosphatase family protein [Paenibacillus sp. CC-CFT742]